MIVILAPYGRTEVTAAAVRLADLAMALGREVKLVACGQREQKVHPLWDSKVKLGSGEGIFTAAHGASHVVHFQGHKAWYDKARLVTEGKNKARHILVPNWHGLFGSDKTLISIYDQIICPNKTCYKIIQSEVFNGESVGRDKLIWTRWDAGIPPVKRDGIVSGGKIKACIYCDASTIDFCAQLVLQLAEELLVVHPKLELTLMSAKSWANKDRQTMVRIKSRHRERLTIRKVSTFDNLNRTFHAHDWVVVPGVRADFAITASRALACGAAVIAHDVPPYSEVVQQSSGLLVPCEIRTGAMKAPIAVPTMGNWLETCQKAFSDYKIVRGLQVRDWNLQESHRAFNGVWTKAWER